VLPLSLLFTVLPALSLNARHVIM